MMSISRLTWNLSKDNAYRSTTCFVHLFIGQIIIIIIIVFLNLHQLQHMTRHHNFATIFLTMQLYKSCGRSHGLSAWKFDWLKAEYRWCLKARLPKIMENDIYRTLLRHTTLWMSIPPWASPSCTHSSIPRCSTSGGCSILVATGRGGDGMETGGVGCRSPLEIRLHM